MKHLIIIGASGFGRDICEMAFEAIGYGVEFDIKGFLVHKDEYLHSLDEFPTYPPVISTIYEYIILEDDIFVNSLGDIHTRKEVTEYMLSKGAQFTKLIHKTARISFASTIGQGTIVAPYAIVGSDSHIGVHSLIQARSLVGHDCKVGNYSTVDCNAVLTGRSSIGDETVVHTSAVINQKTHVGNHCVVGAGSFVVRSVKDNETVYGNPARKL